jgi:hypothetical protein
LIALLVGCLLRSAFDGNLALQIANHFIGWVHLDDALGANNLVGRAVGGAEAARKARQAGVRESQQCRGHFVDFLEARILLSGCRVGEHFFGFCSKHVARRIDAVHAYVVRRATTQVVLQAAVSQSDLLAESRAKNAGITDFSVANRGHCSETAFLEVQAVGDHELHLGVRSGLNHGFTLLLRHGHGLLTKDVNSRSGSGFGVGAMHVVGQRDVDRVNLAAFQAFGKLFVAVGFVHLEFFRQFGALGGIP